MDRRMFDEGSDMTIRQWYAGQALASGLCPHNVYEFDAVAGWCGRMADAMIKEEGRNDTR